MSDTFGGVAGFFGGWGGVLLPRFGTVVGWLNKQVLSFDTR